MPEIIIIRGPLGIGKTTVAKELAKELSAEYFSIDNILDKNNLDKAQGNIPVGNFLKANKILIPQIQDATKQNRTSIIEGNFYYKEIIENLNKELSIEPKIFTLTAPLNICLARDAARQNSYGQLAVRAIYELVASLDYGLEIKANEKNVEEIIIEIKKHLNL